MSKSISRPPAAGTLAVGKDTSAPQRWRVGWSVTGAVEATLITLGLAINFLLVTHALGGDGSVRFHSLSLLLQQGVLDKSWYSLIGPLFSAPLWFLGTVWQSPSWWLSRFNFFAFAAGLLAMYVLLRNRIDRRLLSAFLLILVAASLFPNQVEYYYAEVFTAVFVAVGTVAAVYGPSLAGWALVVVGVANTPGTLLGMGFTVLMRVLQQRRVRYVLALLAAVGVVATENTIRRGGPLNTGYPPGFNTPMFFGLLGILFAYGKGLIFFTPGIFLPVKSRLLTQVGAAGRQLYSLYLLWIAFVVALVLLYSRWWAWYGGYFWGPRFFLFASLPASLVLAVRLRYPGKYLSGNLLTLLALALSCWVAITGMVFEMAGLSACTTGYNALVTLCAYTPQYSELWRALAVPLPFGKRSAIVAGYCVIVFLYVAWPLLRAVTWQIRALWHELTRAEGIRWVWHLRI